MINILKLRQLEKEKKSQELATKTEEKIIEEQSSECDEFPKDELVEDIPVREEAIINEVAEEDCSFDLDKPAPVIDAAEQFRQSLIEQVLNDENMITREELQKEIEIQGKVAANIEEKVENREPVVQPKVVQPKEERKQVSPENKSPEKQSSEKVKSENQVVKSLEEQKSKKANDSIIQLVGFTIGKEYYGIDINRIKEINRMTEITKVPRAPHFIEGVINLRGTVIPVINLRTKVRMAKKEYDKDTRIIIVELSGKTIGFIVDGVKEVLRIPETLLDPPPALAVGKKAEYITSVAKLENDLVILMDPEKVLSNEEVSAIQK